MISHQECGTHPHFQTGCQWDNMYNCKVCKQGFSRKDAVLRHGRHKHGEISKAYLQSSEVYPSTPPPPLQGGIPPPPPPPPLQGGISPPSPPLQGGMPSFEEQRKTYTKDGSSEKPTVLQHPFTMMVSGPTCKYALIYFHNKVYLINILIDFFMLKCTTFLVLVYFQHVGRLRLWKIFCTIYQGECFQL